VYTFENFIKNYQIKCEPWVGIKTTADKIKIYCDKCNIVYEQKLLSTIRGHGCRNCYFISKLGKYTIDETDFLTACASVHKNKYDYSNVKFCGSIGKIEIICPDHGPFTQQANLHRKGHGCRKCSSEKSSIRQQAPEIKVKLRNLAIKNLQNMKSVESKPEKEFKNFLIKNNILFTQQHVLLGDDGSLWAYDFYLLEKNLLVEIDGMYFHLFREQYNKDLIKTKLAHRLGYSLLRIEDCNLDFSLIHKDESHIKEYTMNLLKNRESCLKNKKRK
jgi:very-short-patch-repair endonuclease